MAYQNSEGRDIKCYVVFTGNGDKYYVEEICLSQAVISIHLHLQCEDSSTWPDIIEAREIDDIPVHAGAYIGHDGEWYSRSTLTGRKNNA